MALNLNSWSSFFEGRYSLLSQKLFDRVVSDFAGDRFKGVHF